MLLFHEFFSCLTTYIPKLSRPIRISLFYLKTLIFLVGTAIFSSEFDIIMALIISAIIGTYIFFFGIIFYLVFYRNDDNE